MEMRDDEHVLNISDDGGSISMQTGMSGVESSADAVIAWLVHMATRFRIAGMFEARDSHHMIMTKHDLHGTIEHVYVYGGSDWVRFSVGHGAQTMCADQRMDMDEVHEVVVESYSWLETPVTMPYAHGTFNPDKCGHLRHSYIVASGMADDDMCTNDMEMICAEQYTVTDIPRKTVIELISWVAASVILPYMIDVFERGHCGHFEGMHDAACGVDVVMVMDMFHGRRLAAAHVAYGLTSRAANHCGHRSIIDPYISLATNSTEPS